MQVHVRGSYVVEEGQLCIVCWSARRWFTFNCLVNRARTETECSFVLNIHIVKCVGPSHRGHSSEVEVEVEVEGVWFPQQPGGGIQPRVSQQGVPQQTAAYGTCIMPGCPFPKRVKGSRVHEYCSRTCAQKHRAMPASGHMQNPCLDKKQANLNSACQYPTGHVGVSFEDRNTYQQGFCKGKLLTLVISVWGTDITREMCLGEHVLWGNTYHCNTRKLDLAN